MKRSGSIVSVAVFSDSIFLSKGLLNTLDNLPLKMLTVPTTTEELYQLVNDYCPDIVVIAMQRDIVNIASKIKRINDKILILSAITSDAETPGDKKPWCIDSLFSLHDSKSLNLEVLKYLEGFSGSNLKIKKDFGYIQKYRNGNLTEVEREILYMLCCGYSKQQIAEKRGVKKDTIGKNISLLCTKLNVGDRFDALVCAFRSGFVSEWEKGI